VFQSSPDLLAWTDHSPALTLNPDSTETLGATVPAPSASHQPRRFHRLRVTLVE
jgi:hypothetical protein